MKEKRGTRRRVGNERGRNGGTGSGKGRKSTEKKVKGWRRGRVRTKANKANGAKRDDMRSKRGENKEEETRRRREELMDDTLTSISLEPWKRSQNSVTLRNTESTHRHWTPQCVWMGCQEVSGVVHSARLCTTSQQEQRRAGKRRDEKKKKRKEEVRRKEREEKE